MKDMSLSVKTLHILVVVPICVLFITSTIDDFEAKTLCYQNNLMSLSD